MAEKYLAPEMTLVEYETEDVITESVGGDNDLEDKWDY